MGARLHFPREGAKCGALRIDDPRAKFARIQIDRGDGKGKVDVTRHEDGTWTFEQEDQAIADRIESSFNCHAEAIAKSRGLTGTT